VIGYDLPGAVESGRIGGVAGQAEREVRAWAAGYPDLFGAKPFDATLFTTVCLCTAFSAPWHTSAALRVTNRVATWSFGVDWLIDYVARSRAEVDDVIDRCLTVARGGPADDGDDLMRCLAEIRNALRESVAFPALRHVWLDELERFLRSQAREWDWNLARKDGGRTGPSLQDYLGNADNLGFSFAFASHWLSTATEPPRADDVPKIREASWQAQRTMRLINDLGTYRRDQEWGDLNALMLDVSRDEVLRRMADLRDRLATILEPLRPGHPFLTSYMERQVDFCQGFQGVTDYWGAL
jgi:hypothetical protein